MRKSRSRYYGQAGEYYVLFRLWENEIVAIPAPPGAPSVDILVYDHSYALIATVQVKTRSTKARAGWIVDKKQIIQSKESHFYIFVDLDIQSMGIPTSFVVPSFVVADLGRRIEVNDPKIISELGEQAFGLAKRDPKRVNFTILRPLLKRSHPLLEKDWMKNFENAFELITMPLIRATSIKYANLHKIK